MKKQSVLGLALTVALLSACGGNAENKAAAAATDEVKTTENSGSEAVQKEAETEENEDESAYAVKHQIKFGTPMSFSTDYIIAFVDESNYEEVDNEDFHVIDKGLAEFNFYNVKTWPAEKDGYTTARLTYALDSTNRSHVPEEWGNVHRWISFSEIDLFDYYTGKYIPQSENHTVHTTGSEQTEPVETEIDFGDKKWDLTSWSEEEVVGNHEGYEYTDDSHYDYTEHFSKVISIFVTYPDDYDGLSFAVQSAGEAKVDMDKYIKRAANNERKKYIGKDILSVYEGVKKEDILFCSMKDASSLIIEEVASAEDAAAYIPTYEEREGLTNYTDSSVAECFNLPLKFYVFDNNGELLGEDRAKADKQEVTYAVKDVSITGNGQGVTSVGLTYTANQDLTVDMMDYEGDFSGVAILPDIDVYNCYTGETVEIKTEVQDNSDFGDWVDDTHISYKVDYTCRVEFELTGEERPEEIAVVFGNRKSISGDGVRFKLPYLI